MTYNRQRKGERSGKRTFIYGIVFTALSFLILALVLTLILNGFGHSLVSYLTKQPIPIIKFLGIILKMRGLIVKPHF